MTVLNPKKLIDAWCYIPAIYIVVVLSVLILGGFAHVEDMWFAKSSSWRLTRQADQLGLSGLDRMGFIFGFR
jgi:hypothetical protein